MEAHKVKSFFISSVLLMSTQVYASFPLGDTDNSWGVNVTPNKDGELQLKLGTRLQTITSHSMRNDTVTGETETFQDFSLRRTRFQVQADYKEGIKFYMDVRNDKVNKGDSGEGDFNVGDAYIQVKNILNTKGLHFKAFRAKVDVSRAETISSSKLNYLTRAAIADEAANYVSHNRRANNFQLQGIFDKWYFQLVAGDGVEAGSFHDAKGEDLSSGDISSQNFMVGSKVRFYPITGYEDKSPTETYFGKGKHFSFGAGIFHTGGIKYQSASTNFEVDRTLINGEFSFHYKGLSFLSEYFKFKNVVQDYSTSNRVLGDSDGYFAQVEYVMTEFHYLAPFFRYESWDRFNDAENFDQTSTVAGINWYLRANKIRVGLFYQIEKYDSNIRSTNARGQIFDNNKQINLTTMWHY